MNTTFKLGNFQSPNQGIEAFDLISNDTGNSLTFFGGRWNTHYYFKRGPGPNTVASIDGNYQNAGTFSLYTDAGAAVVQLNAGGSSYLNGGAIGIGTTNPQHLLHVAGTIGAEEVIVSSTGADYVFDPTYYLTPLDEVDQYIKQNGHLPDIPSAEEMHQRGASVGEMQAKLLAKIEELTLHMIEEHQRSTNLEQQIRQLQEQNRMISEKIGALEARIFQ